MLLAVSGIVKYLMKVVTEMGNPFLATSHDVMENVVAMSLSKITEVLAKLFIKNM